MAFTKLLFVLGTLSLVVCYPDGARVKKDNIDIELVPFIASVHIGGNGTYHGSLICGAVIIHESYILTVASCLVKNINNPDEEFDVVVGTTGVGDSDGQKYKVVNVIKHGNYWPESETSEYNIALLELEQPLTFGPKVKNIAYWNYNQDIESNTMVKLTGWFYRNNGTEEEKKHLTFLQKDVPTFSEISCNEICNPEGIFPTHHQLCTEYYCKESSAHYGSALTYDNDLLGINSIFYGCQTTASVYINVASFTDWIDSIIYQNK